MEEIILTKEEASTLADFIELYIFNAIRLDNEIDNIEWLKAMRSIHEKCKKRESTQGDE